MIHKIAFLVALAASLLSFVTDSEKKEIKANTSGIVITRSH